MTPSSFRRHRVGFAYLMLLSCASAVHANPALEGYADDAAVKRRVAALAKSKIATIAALAKTLEGRSVDVVTIGKGNVDKKPAILVVGGVDAAHVAGVELALSTAEHLVKSYPDDAAIKQLLNDHTIYVIPRANPDGTAKNFSRPYREHRGNARRTDDDRDFEVGEDPPEDLNGDGWITMMRIEDDGGEYIPHPKDARVMIKANAKKNERGRYRMLIEGRDNDGDEELNEDGADGVNFNRNFSFKYPAFKKGAGATAVSEAETRAVADFAFDHPNIVAVLTFTPEDNLMHPWQPNATAEKARIKTTLLSDDAPYQNFLAAKYRKLHGGKNAPKLRSGAGSFAEWAYFHYGRWSFAARGWWVPTGAAKKPAVDASEDAKSPDDTNKGETDANMGDAKPKDAKPADDSREATTDKKPPAAAAPKSDSRGADDIKALKWFAKNKIDGFVDWQEIKHPDFPDNKVEVGGFKPHYRLNPPIGEIKSLAEKHAAFLVELSKLFPQIAIKETKVEPLGAGVYRVTATIGNDGFLPTVSKMGDLARQHQRLQAELTLPKNASLVQGVARRDLARLVGNGGQEELVWLVRLVDKKNNVARLRVWSPSVGEAELEFELK
ncbi:MAG: M14 family metallopeptidase [Pirellulales bacterium]|nr:M14 family metallopeptidase [Pirellulales bacterium]